MRRQRGVTSRLKRAVFQIGKRVVREQRSEMRHRERPVQFVDVRFRQIVKLEQQFDEILWAIGFHFQADGVTAAGAP